MAISGDYLKMIEEQDKQRKAESLNNVYGANTKQVTPMTHKVILDKGYILNNKTYLDAHRAHRGYQFRLYFHSQRQSISHDRYRRSVPLRHEKHSNSQARGWLHLQTMPKAICHACMTLRRKQTSLP